MPAPSRFAELRRDMVENQLRARGVRDQRVLEAMARVPREEFVPHETADLAYSDQALSIGGGQTISQPFVVAFTMAAAGVRGGDTVLDVGTGSGYAAAVLSCLAERVLTVERSGELALAAAERLRRLGFGNVRCAIGDGVRGWPQYAPFHAIVAAAAAEDDAPPAWIAQLRTGGRLVAPLGPADRQQLVRITKTSNGRSRERLLAVRYVPLIAGGECDGDLIELPLRFRPSNDLGRNLRYSTVSSRGPLRVAARLHDAQLAAIPRLDATSRRTLEKGAATTAELPTGATAPI